MTATADDLIMAVAARQHAAFHRTQALHAGLTRGQMRSRRTRGRWIARSRDVFVIAGSPDSFEQRVWVALLEAGPGAAVSHRTAARLRGVPGYERCTDIDILRPEHGDHSALHGNLHRTSNLPAEHVSEVNGFPCTTLARTLFDLASLSSTKRLRRAQPFVHEKRVARALDNALTRLGLDIDDMALLVATHGKRGRDGTTLMRTLVNERSDGEHCTESELEELLVAVLTACGVPLPELQVRLGNGERQIGRVDGFYRREQVVIEADSRRHHSALLDSDNDRWRDLRLLARGVVTVRVTWWDLVNRPEEFVALLRQILETRREAA